MLRIMLLGGLMFALLSSNTLSTTPLRRTIDSDRIVERHNHYRAKVGVPPLSWSNDLATQAQRWADHLASRRCAMDHSPSGGRYGNDYGENLFWTSERADEYEAIDDWASEVSYFNSRTRKHTHLNGHYTQMVWRETTEVGCAVAVCSDGAEIWVCNYNPAGNIVGEPTY